MSLRIVVISIFLISLFKASDCSAQYQYPGTNLRGKVMTYDSYNRPYPVTYASIDLYVYANNQWILVANTMTDAYGFYYFRQIQPNNYVVQVNRLKNYNITVVWIDYSRYSYQDIPILYF